MERLFGVRDIVLMSFYFHPAIEKKFTESGVSLVHQKMGEYLGVVEFLREYPDVCASVGLDVDTLIKYFHIVMSICEEKVNPSGNLERLEAAMENTITESDLLSNLFLTAMDLVEA